MAFRINAPIDSNQHKGLLAVNSINGNPLALTGLSLTNAQPLHVAIVDGSGSQITTFGGGTQYTDGGVVPAHPIGPTLEWSDGTNWQTVSTAKPLPITIVSGGGSGGTSSNFGAGFPTAGTAIGIKNGSGNMFAPQTIEAGAGIGSPNSSDSMLPIANFIYNGNTAATALEARRNLTSTNNTAGAGVAAAGLVGQFDDVSPGTITENNVGSIRMSTNRNLYGTVRDAAGNERGLNVSSGGNISVDTVTNLAQIAATVPTFTNVNGTTQSLNVFVENASSGSLLGKVNIYDSTNTNAASVNGSGQLTISNSTFAVTNTGTFAVQATLAANQSVNVAQINGVTPLMGNGVTGTGSQRVTIASDNTAFSVNAVQSGTWNIATVTTVTTVATVTSLSQFAGNAIATNNGSVSAGTLRTTQAGAATGTLSNVAGSATSVTILAANTARQGATVTNDSSALLYLKFGSTASTTSYTVVLAGTAGAPFTYYEVPANYNGIITGIWASATGNARVTEIS